ncbi:DHA2 family efflux MFS transporter permease subunit [Hydrocarboniphaga sp.]|uniref:DHA2 family efflux MFS transporter permease subunit n=1 Tax=Hydrocarboniphaga sp. TaxID=2033016 RepID=UPI0026193AD8|nr:DHA2 family efflux MFS transporter permease subunit [Hydrocarboniphaga sp.]
MAAAPTATPYWLAAVVGFGAFMEVLDTSIANVSLSHIAGSLAASQEEATWVLTSYLVANAIILPMTGWLSNVIGRRRYYIASIILFTLASVLCGLAPSLPVLIVARVLQGLAGGALQPVSQAILSDAFPQSKRGTAMAIYAMAVICGPAIGPPLGGLITDTFSWHWIFLLNAPVGVLLAIAAFRLVHDSPAQLEAQRLRRTETFTVDYLGFALIVIGMGTLQIMLDKGQQEDWLDSGFIRGCLFVSVSALLALIVWELRHPHPIVNLRLLKNRNFATSNLLIFFMGMAMFGIIVLMPQFTQSVLGYSALDAGIVMSPGALLMFCMMPLAARVATKVEPRALISVGFVVFGAGLLVTAHFTSLGLAQHQLVLMRMAQVAGIAFLMVPINMLAYVGLPPSEGGNASALLNLMRNLGSGVGISLAVSWLSRGVQMHQAQLVDRVSLLDPAYQQTIATLGRRFDIDTAHAMIAGMVQKQAMVLAYIDDYHYFALLAFLIAPLIWFAKKPPADAPPPPLVH